jgi:hypothetical protein
MKNITLLSFAFVAFSLTLFAQPKADPENRSALGR